MLSPVIHVCTFLTFFYFSVNSYVFLVNFSHPEVKCISIVTKINKICYLLCKYLYYIPFWEINHNDFNEGLETYPNAPVSKEPHTVFKSISNQPKSLGALINKGPWTVEMAKKQQVQSCSVLPIISHLCLK